MARVAVCRLDPRRQNDENRMEMVTACAQRQAKVAQVFSFASSCHVSRDTVHFMITSFRDRRTQQLFIMGAARGVPPDVSKRAFRKLHLLDAADSAASLRYPAGNRLHLLTGERAGQYSIAVNRQWRICFFFVAGHAYDVEFCDYH